MIRHRSTSLAAVPHTPVEFGHALSRLGHVGRMPSPPNGEYAERMRELGEVLAYASVLFNQIAGLTAAPVASPQWVAVKFAARELGVHADTVWTHAKRLGVAHNVGGSGGRRMVDLTALRTDIRGGGQGL